MTPYSLLIFDLDGTLINSLGDITWSLNYTLEHYGLSSFTEEMVKTFIGNGSRVLVEEAVESCGVDDINASGIDEMLQFYLKTYEENLLRTTHCYDGVIDLLTRTESPDFISVILTNKPERLSRHAAQGLGLSGFVEKVIGPETYGIRKPDPGVVHLLMKEYDIAPERTLFIGDSGVDLKTAQNAGIDSALVTYGFEKKHELKGATYLINHFSELQPILGLS